MRPRGFRLEHVAWSLSIGHNLPQRRPISSFMGYFRDLIHSNKLLFTLNEPFECRKGIIRIVTAWCLTANLMYRLFLFLASWFPDISSLRRGNVHIFSCLYNSRWSAVQYKGFQAHSHPTMNIKQLHDKEAKRLNKRYDKRIKTNNCYLLKQTWCFEIVLFESNEQEFATDVSNVHLFICTLASGFSRFLHVLRKTVQ